MVTGGHPKAAKVPTGVEPELLHSNRPKCPSTKFWSNHRAREFNVLKGLSSNIPSTSGLTFFDFRPYSACIFGRTLEEARAMAEEAIRCVIESNVELGEPVPQDFNRDPIKEQIAVDIAA